MTIKKIKTQILPILKRSDVVKVAIFGSLATGKTKKNSDIDLLIKFKREKSLLDLVRLKYKLEDKTNRKIDLITYNSVHPLLKISILKEQKIIYEKRS